jgi:SAM-dependent methyltransferase
VQGKSLDKTICRICGAEGNHPEYAVPEMMFGSAERFTYFQCTGCHCLQLKAPPSDPGRYYPRGYHSFSFNPESKYRHPVARAARRLANSSTVFSRSIAGIVFGKAFRNRKLVSLSRIPLTRESRILDVGCGAGERIYALREIGFRNVSGVDPYIGGDIEYMNGVKIAKKSVHDLQGTWDVIMYHHSFEHVPEPTLELRAVAGLLGKGGVCLLRIPTVSSHAWDRYREHWYQIDAPRHLFLHSVESMSLLAEKTGFHVHSVVYDSTADQFARSESYRMGIPFTSPDSPRFSTSQRRRWKREARELNRQKRGDQAAFYLLRA